MTVSTLLLIIENIPRVVKAVSTLRQRIDDSNREMSTQEGLDLLIDAFERGDSKQLQDLFDDSPKKARTSDYHNQ